MAAAPASSSANVSPTPRSGEPWSAARIGAASRAELLEALGSGLPDGLSEQALLALSRHRGDADVVTVLRGFADHRASQVRVAALQGLEQALGGGALPELRRALGDSDPAVRRHAALALVELGSEADAPRLLAAMDHGVVAAGPAYAHHMGAAGAEALNARLRVLPLPAVLPAFGVALARRDLPLQARLSLVSALAELGTPAVRVFLLSERAKGHLGVDRDLQLAIDAAIARQPKVLQQEAR